MCGGRRKFNVVSTWSRSIVWSFGTGLVAPDDGTEWNRSWVLVIDDIDDRGGLFAGRYYCRDASTRRDLCRDEFRFHSARA